MHYLIAAEQGNKEGQASLAWLLDKSMAAAPAGSSPFALVRPVWDRLVRSARSGDSSSSSGSDGGGGGGSSESGSAGGTGDPGREQIGAGAGEGADADADVESRGGRRNRRSGIGGVVDAVRELGGDPESMARRYRRLAAEQGDSEARYVVGGVHKTFTTTKASLL